MEFGEKIQQLRKQRSMTQEELAKALFVSRTAISKWESNRGYPSIDSLKEISSFFEISIDELLSGKELISVAEKDNQQKMQHMRDLVFGLIDCAIVMFLFFPFFGQHKNGLIEEISLISLTEVGWYIRDSYWVMVMLTIIFGITTLALQNYQGAIWNKYKNMISVILSAICVFMFTLTLQPYAASFTFMFLIIKAVLLIKRA